MSEIAKELGKNLRARRLEIGLSQEKVGLDVNLDRSYIGRIERGEVNVTIEVLYRIAFLLKCHPRDWLPEMPETPDFLERVKSSELPTE